MKHWHECSVCKEYFECACGASHRVLVFCGDCLHMRVSRLRCPASSWGSHTLRWIDLAQELAEKPVAAIPHAGSPGSG